MTRIETGKKAYLQFQSPCSRCKNGITLEAGVGLKAKGRRKKVFTFEDLCKLHHDFEKENAALATKRLGVEIKPDDDLLKFVVERTELCPHKLITPLSYYWIETIAICDGEMGLALPDKMQDVPAIFFDALAIVRSERAKVKSEEKET